MFLNKELKYNWIGHNFRQRGWDVVCDEVCIYTIHLSGDLDDDLNYISKMGNCHLIEKHGCYAKVLDDSYRGKHIKSSPNLSEILLDLKENREKREKEGYIDVLSSDYGGYVRHTDFCMKLANKELFLLGLETLVEQLVCVDNKGFEDYFDIGVSYLLVKPTIKNKLKLKCILDDIGIYDKYGNQQSVPYSRFKLEDS